METEPSEIPVAERELLAGAERRIARAMWVLGIVGLLACWLWRDWSWGAGFVIGALLSALNFHWLKGVVGRITEVAAPAAASERIAEARPSGRPAGAAIRFVLRYALMGVAAYVILKSSVVSLLAFFLGLFLSLAAILVEVGYQIYCGFRNA